MLLVYAMPVENTAMPQQTDKMCQLMWHIRQTSPSLVRFGSMGSRNSKFNDFWEYSRSVGSITFASHTKF